MEDMSLILFSYVFWLKNFFHKEGWPGHSFKYIFSAKISAAFLKSIFFLS